MIKKNNIFKFKEGMVISKNNEFYLVLRVLKKFECSIIIKIEQLDDNNEFDSLIIINENNKYYILYNQIFNLINWYTEYDDSDNKLCFFEYEFTILDDLLIKFISKYITSLFNLDIKNIIKLLMYDNKKDIEIKDNMTNCYYHKDDNSIYQAYNNLSIFNTYYFGSVVMIKNSNKYAIIANNIEIADNKAFVFYIYRTQKEDHNKQLNPYFITVLKFTDNDNIVKEYFVDCSNMDVIDKDNLCAQNLNPNNEIIISDVVMENIIAMYNDCDKIKINNQKLFNIGDICIYDNKYFMIINKKDDIKFEAVEILQIDNGSLRCNLFVVLCDKVFIINKMYIQPLSDIKYHIINNFTIDMINNRIKDTNDIIKAESFPDKIISIQYKEDLTLNNIMNNKYILVKEWNHRDYKVLYEYDDNGNKIHFKDSNDLEIWYEYDNNGNKIHFKDSNDLERWYTYDNNGNLIHYKTSNGLGNMV